MGILGILTCEILELEFARLLAADKEVSRITALEDERSAQLIAALESIKKDNLRRITHLAAFTPVAENALEVLVGVLELGLRTEVCAGTFGILQQTWEAAKKYLASINGGHDSAAL